MLLCKHLCSKFYQFSKLSHFPQRLQSTFIVSRGYTAHRLQIYASSRVPSRSITSENLPRKKKRRLDTSNSDLLVVAYAISKQFHFPRLRQWIKEQNLYSISPDLDVSDIERFIHLTPRYPVQDSKPREIFFFQEGCVVFWNVNEIERLSIVRDVQQFGLETFSEDVILEESEMMDYCYTDVNKAKLVKGCIQLRAEEDNFLEKYTFSNALALSVKLGIWEAELDFFVQRMHFVYDDLKKGARIRLSRKQVLQKYGELFDLRHLINLSSDLLDTPDFYWERETLEALYQKMCFYLNIYLRTKVMNEKLSQCCDLVELLSSNLNDQHHVRLEWMIIILIMIEVLFEIIHLCDRYIFTSYEAVETVQETTTSENE